MANFSFLYVLVAVVLLSEVVPTQVSAESDSYYKTLRTAAATRLRRRGKRNSDLSFSSAMYHSSKKLED